MRKERRIDWLTSTEISNTNHSPPPHSIINTTNTRTKPRMICRLAHILPRVFTDNQGIYQMSLGYKPTSASNPPSIVVQLLTRTIPFLQSFTWGWMVHWRLQSIMVMVGATAILVTGCFEPAVVHFWCSCILLHVRRIPGFGRVRMQRFRTRWTNWLDRISTIILFLA